MLEFYLIERWAWCFQKIRHWKSRGNFFELRKYVHPVAVWFEGSGGGGRLRSPLRPSPPPPPPPTSSCSSSCCRCCSCLGTSTSSGSILDLDWLTFIETNQWKFDVCFFFLGFFFFKGKIDHLEVKYLRLMFYLSISSSACCGEFCWPVLINTLS